MKRPEIPSIYCSVGKVAQEVAQAARDLIAQEYELCHCFYGDVLSVECRGQFDWMAVHTVGCDFHVDEVYEEDVGVTAFLCLESAPGGHAFEVDDGKSPPISLTLKAGDVFLFDSKKLHRLRGDSEEGAPFLGLLIDISDRKKKNIPDFDFWQRLAANEGNCGVELILGKDKKEESNND